MKKFTLLLFTCISTQVSAQQLISAVNNASGDIPNIQIANQSAANTTGDPRSVIWLDNDGRLKFRNATGAGY